MVKNIYSGDPAIRITEDGASMTFRGGQPVMDAGLGNPIVISLHTKPGWWGNTLFPIQSQKLGSNWERQRTIVDVSTINDMRDDGNGALKWMKDVGLAQKIEISITNPYMDQLHAVILVTMPGGDVQKFLVTKNGLNWIFQAFDPAYPRL